MQGDRPDFNLAWALPEDPAEAEATRVRAADLVEGYVRDQSLAALDRVLAPDVDDAGAVRAAQDAAAASRLVDAEVRRFRELASRRG